MNTYTAGRVSIMTGSARAFGTDTDWLASNVMPGDLLLINGDLCEISDVISSTELAITPAFRGSNIESSFYTIIHTAKQTLSPDLALAIEKLIANITDLKNDYQDKLTQTYEYAKLFKQVGLYVDEDYEISHGEGSIPDESKIDPEDIASDESVDSLIDDILG